MSQNLDPASIAALTAQLVARCENGKFNVTSVPTALGDAPVNFLAQRCPAQKLCIVTPLMPHRLVTWSAQYRQHVFSEMVVVDASLDQVAVAYMTVRAAEVLDLLDLQAPINVARHGGAQSDGGFP